MLPIGKISNEILKRIVFKHLGSMSEDIIEGAHIAGDAAVINFHGNNYLAIKTDPITGAVKNVGKHSIIINSNDISARGAIPKYFLVNILLPPRSTITDLETICKDISDAAAEFNISIIGGHSEVTPVVNAPVIIGMMIGELRKDRMLFAKNIEIGDKIILTKSVGIEGTSIIAHDHYNLLTGKVTEQVIDDAKKLIDKISIFKESITIHDIDGIKFMHDPTEGGLLAGIIETCMYIKKGFLLRESDIPIYASVKVICKQLNLNPLRLLGSGALIIICRPDISSFVTEKIIKIGIPAKEIGEITRAGFRIISKSGKLEEVENITTEELWRLENK